MRKYDVQIALEGVAEARKTWTKAKREFDHQLQRVMVRLLHEASLNYMSAEEVARYAGLSKKRVRDLMRLSGLNPRDGKRTLADSAAKALASNADLLGIPVHEMDLMSPLAYLPAGSLLRQQITDKAVSQVHELPEDDAAFYAEHYADWNVVTMQMTVTVPTTGNREDAEQLVREILDGAAFDIRVSVSGNQL